MGCVFGIVSRWRSTGRTDSLNGWRSTATFSTYTHDDVEPQHCCIDSSIGHKYRYRFAVHHHWYVGCFYWTLSHRVCRIFKWYDQDEAKFHCFNSKKYEILDSKYFLKKFIFEMRFFWESILNFFYFIFWTIFMIFVSIESILAIFQNFFCA